MEKFTLTIGEKAKLSSLTAENAHSEAIVALAKMMSARFGFPTAADGGRIPDLVRIAEDIAFIHQIEGHMPHSLFQYREEIAKEISSYFREEDIAGCF